VTTGLRAAYRLLTSRRLAVALIMSIALYSALGTSVPQHDIGMPDRYPQWAAQHRELAALAEVLGLRNAFSAPLFVALAGVLAAATLACALERSRRAVLALRHTGKDRIDAAGSRLDSNPQHVAHVAGSVDDVRDAVGGALRRAGFRVRSSGQRRVGISGRWGLVGSPVFHWSLGLIIVTAGAARLLFAVGFLEVPVGGSVVEQHGSYAQLEEGLLFGERHSGLVVGAQDLVPNYVDHGVAVGASPVVSLARGDTQVARGRVFPNSPLRYGPYMYHLKEYGMAARLTLVGPNGMPIDSTWVFFRLSADESMAVSLPMTYRITDPAGASTGAFTAWVPLERVAGRYTHAVPERPALLVSVMRPSAGSDSTATLEAGRLLPVTPNLSIRLDRMTHSVVLAVTYDPTLPIVYGLLIVSALALAVAVLVPTHVVWLDVRPASDGKSEVRVNIWSARTEPLMNERLRSKLLGELGGDAGSSKRGDG
jgi:cytochrome c biogenesis protein ResB